MNPIKRLEAMEKPKNSLDFSSTTLELFKLSMNTMLLLNGAAAIALIGKDFEKFADPILMFALGTLFVPVVSLLAAWATHATIIYDDVWHNIFFRIEYCVRHSLLQTLVVVMSCMPMGMFFIGVIKTAYIVNMMAQ